jgi:aldose 1-epimerase
MIDSRKLFGKLAGGDDVFLCILENKSGMRAAITNYGAAVVSLHVPDRKGIVGDVVLGYDSLNAYVNDKAYFGVIIGRYGNRICKGRFRLNEKEYRLTVNDGENHLHGGIHGFHKLLWRSEPRETESGQSLVLAMESPDGDEGYPGKVTLQVTYTITDRNELRIDYTGSTDKTTILNPTHHSYFNLTGLPTNTILRHHLQIDADTFTPVSKGLITTGDIVSVADTPMDFRAPKAIGLHINKEYEQLMFGRGYDHNWVLRDFDGKVRRVAELYDPESGRLLTMSTDQPGLQFYSGNFLDGTARGKSGIPYQQRAGLCLEAQHFPDSPNKPQFPSVTLNAGDTYHQTTIYQFSTR